MSKQIAETSEAPKKSPMDFGELRNDTDFVTKSNNLEKVSIIIRLIQKINTF